MKILVYEMAPEELESLLEILLELSSRGKTIISFGRNLWQLRNEGIECEELDMQKPEFDVLVTMFRHSKFYSVYLDGRDIRLIRMAVQPERRILDEIWAGPCLDCLVYCESVHVLNGNVASYFLHCCDDALAVLEQVDFPH